MFRILLKVGIILTIILIATFYYLPLSQGRTPVSPVETIKVVANKVWLRIKNINLSVPDLPKSILPESTPSPQEPVTVYRWKDATGQWHYSNTPPDQPEKLAHYSSLIVNPDTNIIQGMPPVQESKTPDTTDNASTEIPPENSLPNPYSKDAIEKLFKQTESISKNMKNRESALQDINQSIR